MDAHTIGQRIKEARLAKKMTQAEVVGECFHGRKGGAAFDLA